MAEAHANETDDALARIENAIRTQLLGAIPRASGNLSAVA